MTPVERATAESLVQEIGGPRTTIAALIEVLRQIGATMASVDGSKSASATDRAAREMEKLLDMQAVSEMAAVHPKTIRRQVATGHLRAIGVGQQLRFSRRDVEQ